MNWNSFFTCLPTHEQKIYYFGESIKGVFKGRYVFSPDDPVSPHVIICEEEMDPETKAVLAEYGLDKMTMTVDRMDAPWWMPYEGQSKPDRPEKDYPDNYPWRKK